MPSDIGFLLPGALNAQQVCVTSGNAPGEVITTDQNATYTCTGGKEVSIQVDECSPVINAGSWPFTQVFNIPAGTTGGVSWTLSIASDDSATVFLNGTQIDGGICPVGCNNLPNCPSTNGNYAIGTVIGTGPNTLVVNMINSAVPCSSMGYEFCCYYGTAALTPTSTTTQTMTFTSTPTPTASATPTETPTSTPTSSTTATPTATSTPSATFTVTPTSTVTETPTVTLTPTTTLTPTPTYSSTASFTPTFSPTPTPSDTITETPSVTWTPTPSPTPTSTYTSTTSFTPTWSPTVTMTPTITLSPTVTLTPTITLSPTETLTPTATIPFVDIFYVDQNVFRPSQGPVSLEVEYSQFPGPYSLKVYNSAGEFIRDLSKDGKNPGILSAPISQWYPWHGTNMNNDQCASGVYLFYLTEPASRKLKKVILIR